MSEQKAVVTLTEDTLAKIVSNAAAAAAAAAVEAANKPKPLTEDQQNDLAMKQQMRDAIAQQGKIKRANEKAFQKVCPHQHKKTGQTAAVHIRDLDYFLCQHCGIQVRAGVKPENAPKDDPFTYNTELYNRLAMAQED